MSMALGSGSRVGDYVLDTYIGGGSFGAVWKGHSPDLEDEVAVKLLTGPLALDTKARAEIELLAAAAASHSGHVVKVLGGGAEPVPHIVMEFIHGNDLQSLLRDKGHLDVDQTIAVASAIADALRALEEVDIIHRDIKPANVMLDEQGVVKLADFGIAKIVGYETVTTSGQAPMTMAYAAPEVWDESGKFGRPSHRSDLYAMGILLYQCLTGATPFSGNYGALFKAHAEDRPDYAMLPAETPASLAVLIRSCLEKRQVDRPKDAVACAAAIARAETELRETRGFPTGEPRKMGPWLKDQPHLRQPWAWRCHHESTGEPATVEVHFAHSTEYGAHLRQAVATNPRLALLGAERLLGTNRLLLLPGESWQASPAGQFQFWVAREDREPGGAGALVTPASLETMVLTIQRLLAAARSENIGLDLRELRLHGSDSIYLGRPGLAEEQGDPDSAALVFLRSLNVDSASRSLLAGVETLEALADQFGGTAYLDSDATRFSPPNPEATVLSPPPIAIDRTQTGPRDNGAPSAVPYAPPAPACPRCLTPVGLADVFCGNCGQHLPHRVASLCPRCRNQIEDDDVFCGTCGQRLEPGSVRRPAAGFRHWPENPGQEGDKQNNSREDRR